MDASASEAGAEEIKPKGLHFMQRKLITLSQAIAIRTTADETKLVQVFEANLQQVNAGQYAAHITRYFDSATSSMVTLGKPVHILINAKNVRSQQEVA